MAEIKISDLSVGDWVRVDDFDNVLIKRVSAIDGTRNQIGIIKNNRGGIYWYCDDEIEPIPLTPEILEKNGFVKSSEYRWSNPSIGCACLRLGTKYWDIRINGRNRAYRPTRISIDNILHTHELQHALRLAGVGKEIEV